MLSQLFSKPKEFWVLIIGMSQDMHQMAIGSASQLSDDVPVHAAAVLLHPGYRKAYIDKVWKKR